MRTKSRRRVFGAAFAATALVLAACSPGSGEDATVPDGPTITVASFNFPESVILAEIYAQALEDGGYPIERNLNLGSRELIFPEIESGAIGFLPEYLGSSIGVGFGETPPNSTSDAVAMLSDLFSAEGVSVLEPAPGQDKNVFVVTSQFAADNNLTSVSDLADLEGVTLGGPPECEERSTCYAGLVESYGLADLRFEAIQEGAARVAALEAGDIQVALLFSTQPVITVKCFVALEGPEDIISPENIIPVVNDEIVDAYGDDFLELINSISEKITTEVLLDLNGRVELDAENPDDVATEWLVENGFLDG